MPKIVYLENIEDSPLVNHGFMEIGVDESGVDCPEPVFYVHKVFVATYGTIGVEKSCQRYLDAKAAAA